MLWSSARTKNWQLWLHNLLFISNKFSLSFSVMHITLKFYPCWNLIKYTIFLKLKFLNWSKWIMLTIPSQWFQTKQILMRFDKRSNYIVFSNDFWLHNYYIMTILFYGTLIVLLRQLFNFSSDNHITII